MKIDSAELKAYIQKLANEKESMIAKFLEEKKVNIDQIVLVERPTKDGGRIFYPEIRSKIEAEEKPLLEAVATDVSGYMIDEAKNDRKKR